MKHEKDTRLVICNTVPIDRKYQHTLYFNNQAEQEDYFDAKADYEFDNLSYQRVGKNKIRVAILADKIYGDNYLYFKNFNSGTYTDEYNDTHAANGKRFYAFIVGVEYINGNTSEITYEIDVMQTWFFNYDLGECFVEREHVEDDTVGLHTVAEPVDASSIKCSRMFNTNEAGYWSDMSTYSVVIASGYDEDHRPGGTYAGLPTGLNYVVFDTDTNGIDDFLDYLQTLVDNEKDDAVVSIWIQPTCTIDKSQGYETALPYDTLVIQQLTRIDGYTPLNNKLYTYPYNYLVIDAGSEQGTFRWEWFNKALYGPTDDTARGIAAFWFYSSTCPYPEMMCVPTGYNEYYTYTSNDNIAAKDNFTEAVVLRDYPQIAWASDAYRAWVAGGGYTTAFLGVMSGVGQIAAGTAALGAGMEGVGISAVTSGLTSAAGSIQTAINEANKGATGHGTQSSTVMASSRAKDFYLKFMTLTYNQAVAIDDFFNMYGYQVNCIKVPNRSARPYWNYVKTRNCKIIYSSVPADDASKIESIYDNGITFWKATTPLVGSYQYDNRLSN